MRKQPKPTNNNGSIALIFKIDGKQHKLTGYGSYEDKKAIALANSFASKLYGDYLSGNLKPLEQYQPKQAAKNLLAPKPQILTCYKLYSFYKEYKLTKVCEKTAQTYQTVLSSLVTCGANFELISNKTKVKERVTNGNTPYIAKLICQHLEAASKWAYSNELIDKHYLEHLSYDLPSGRSKPEPKPFTLKQKWDIGLAFFDSNDYSYLHDFVIFLFETGCRPCEAIGLQWGDVDLAKKQINLGRSIVHLNNGTKQERAVSKTGKNRIFPMNNALYHLLASRKPELFSKDELVFTSKEGFALDLNNFRRRAWKAILEELGIDASLYTPYSTRDTFITLALEQKVDIRTIAKLCDNSPTIIYKHYAGWVNEIAPINFE